MKMHLLLYIFLTIGCGFLSCNQDTIRIIRAPMPSDLDTVRENNQILEVNRGDYFLVKGINIFNRKEAKTKIADFVKNIPDSIVSRYYYYDAYFYQLSGKVNIGYIKELPPEERYSVFIYNKDKCLISYEWMDGKLWSVQKKSKLYFSPNLKLK